MLNTRKSERAAKHKTAKGFTPFSQVEQPSHAEISNRAYKLYEKKGRQNAQDWDDWFRAEKWFRQNRNRRQS